MQQTVPINGCHAEELPGLHTWELPALTRAEPCTTGRMPTCTHSEIISTLILDSSQALAVLLVSNSEIADSSPLVSGGEGLSRFA